MPIRLRILDARELKGLTQEQLAAKAGIRRATLSRLERGLTKGVDFATLERLADALEVSADRLVVHEPKRRR
jgi:transcriptional regulator with XRE-family HTH domain